ncbi:cation diffusion zinc membrane transporter Zrg17 [Friedmanniomyces endolithicus]|nr:cation diffusion zinc membrane transporter Zrg17 [Friedmanniomyces endolithicus]KAK1824601.1 cation diffusion zinc membrane transporter Zrg17 [Friedmanniomyces endolithicus]
MASTLPIPAPPSTPTPPNEEGYALGSMPDGLGIKQNYTPPPAIRTVHDYDIQKGITESPSAASGYGGNTDSAATMLSPTRATLSTNGLSPQSTYYSPATPQTAGLDGGFQTMDAGASADSPFNFTTVQYTSGKGSISKSEALGRRKGHKYRHSSIHVSHMDSIVQAPTARTPLTVPASLPMPTRKEAWWSMTSHQTARLFSGAGSLAMTALSRLLLFDAAGATVCVAVDVMENFEVWKRSSIKHPFGLERADVLAGFGMAVFITFMGLDIISHGIQHSLENIGHHESHSPHSHERVAAGPVDISALLSITSTLVSAVLLRNHARIGRAMRLNLIAGWGKILSNPSHFLTLSASCLLLIMPFLNMSGYKYFDLSFSFVIALLMIAFGVRLGMSLASMLLMSYKPHARDKRAVREVIDEIETDPGVSSVEEARFWQVHYGLCMANLKLRYRNGVGYGDEMMRIRQRVTSLIRQRLGDVKGVVWEISVQMAVERD